VFRLFEIGYEIHPQGGADGLLREAERLVACVFAREGDGVAGLLECKRLAECLAPGAAVRPVAARPFEHPARGYEIEWRGSVVGRIGEFHPNLVEDGRAAMVDLDLDAVFTLGAGPKRHQPLRRFPTSAFDLSVIAGGRELVGGIQRQLEQRRVPHVLAVNYVRQYSGPPLAEGTKSVSFRVTVGSDDRTLSAEEIGEIRSTLIEAMREAGYELRM
jgi:phenylalanyl-tRNA synthetase beta chain